MEKHMPPVMPYIEVARLREAAIAKANEQGIENMYLQVAQNIDLLLSEGLNNAKYPLGMPYSAINEILKGQSIAYTAEEFVQGKNSTTASSKDAEHIAA